MRKKTIDEFRKNGGHLPPIMRDFHDQKDIFKAMHELFDKGDDSSKNMPGWVDGQIYTIDWFLWFMASRGYTLQKSRANVAFKDLGETIEQSNQRRMKVLGDIISSAA